MFTPQEIQEQTFAKAVFGGYDMQQVDDFLEPLTEDYITLYKENSVLKSKMKILVEKLEEYRGQEAAMKQSMAETKKKCDQMLAEAQQKSGQLAAETIVKTQSEDLKKLLAQEEERVNCAKQTALNFINVVEHDIKGHLELLETLKSRDMSQETKFAAEPAREKPYDWTQDEKPAMVVPPAAPQSSETPQDIASEISESLEKLVGPEGKPAAPSPKAAKPMHPDSATIKFNDLKFGKNYDPTSV